MKGYMKVRRCKECGKIYPGDVPELCFKCGVKLGWVNEIFKFFMSQRVFNYTDNCEEIVAKKTLFGWKVREENNNADMRVQDEDPDGRNIDQ